MSDHGAELQRDGVSLGLVPTMGCLHEGHLSLIGLLDGRCDMKAVSIFVNPIQFGEGEDIDRYPRDEARDMELLREHGCELLFSPAAEEMFPQGFQTRLEVQELSKPLCGMYRPDHFRGVATVVLKLFNLTRCCIAAFGLKDYQQARVIERMVDDLNLSVELVFGETVREPDGLAMSTRNCYLEPAERETASLLPKALEWARRHAINGETDCNRIIEGMSAILGSKPGIRIQYLEAVDPVTLQPCREVGDSVQILIGAFVGRTRLIDNIRIGPGSGTKPIQGIDV